MKYFMITINNKDNKILKVTKVTARAFNGCEELLAKQNFIRNYNYLCKLTKNSLNKFDVFNNKSVFLLKSLTYSFYILKREDNIKVFFLIANNHVITLPIINDKIIPILNENGSII